MVFTLVLRYLLENINCDLRSFIFPILASLRMYIRLTENILRVALIFTVVCSDFRADDNNLVTSATGQTKETAERVRNYCH